jgi:hypothetical protein
LLQTLGNSHAPLRKLTAANGDGYGQGFKKANKRLDADWLRTYNVLPVEYFCRYGGLDFDNLKTPPTKVEARGVRAIYDGRRLLIKRGIQEKGDTKGLIVARVEDRAFCFTNSINGIKLADDSKWKYQVILGILWSSLARYFYFMIASGWGAWHHELHLEDEILALPICLPESGPLRRRILLIVQTLQKYDPPVRNVLNPNGVPEEEIRERRHELELELDEAIFELYELNEAEIDLIRDLCEIQMDFFYHGTESEAAKPIWTRDTDSGRVATGTHPDQGLHSYLQVFSRSWSRYLDPGTELRWQLHGSPDDAAMLAVVFSMQREDGDSGPDYGPRNEDDGWLNILRRLDTTLQQPVSSRIYVEGMVRAVTAHDIIVIKRNERRFWTRSMAREDAEATLVQAMKRAPAGDD